MPEILDEGYYCTNCGFFENPSDMGTDMCEACGCSKDAHAAAQVIEVEE
jgi:hypothetical protein